VIRPFEHTDEDAIIAVWLAASRLATPFLSDAFLIDEERSIRELWLEQAETWVYETADGIIGFVSLIGNEVGGLFVAPRFHRRGIGGALMDHAVHLKGELVLDVFRDNGLGRKFYERYGFRAVGEGVHAKTGHAQMRMAYTP